MKPLADVDVYGAAGSGYLCTMDEMQIERYRCKFTLKWAGDAVKH